MPDVTVLQEFPANSEVDYLRTALNQLIDDVKALATKLNADAGVTDTNYVGTTAGKVLVHN